jgi:XTP/dITP diphosphohydrolase
MELVFATRNAGKLKEIAALMPAGYTLIGLDEVGIAEDIPEPFDTMDANALHKARYVFERTGKAAFADDSGLEVDALDGRPGVYSARYAGEAKDPDANMDKLLGELKEKQNRAAQFRTVIAYVNGKSERTFEGIIRGEILQEKRGGKGFGYDPVFLPEGYEKSFAEMEFAEKNKISHRARAFAKFLAVL